MNALTKRACKQNSLEAWTDHKIESYRVQLKYPEVWPSQILQAHSKTKTQVVERDLVEHKEMLVRIMLRLEYEKYLGPMSEAEGK
jgi:hypothetical protein